METICKNCKHFLGGGDFGLCCDRDYGLWYENSSCEDWEPKDSAKEQSEKGETV